MGDKARTGADSYFKMNVAAWLLLILGVITLATPALSSEPRVVCYYTNWSVYRPGTARFNPQNINPYLCTHLIYAFGGFTKDNTLKPFDKYQDIEKGGYAKFTGLKTYNKNLKTMLAIGGWNEGSSRFSSMVASRERRKEFVGNAIKFLRQNRFDGLDLDWEYPAFRDGGKPKDRENYARLVKELRKEFEREAEKTNKPRLLLTMAVPAGIEYIQKGFDVKTLNTYLDWMNLLTYDYHSAFEPAVNHHAPLYPLEEPNEYSVDTELNIDYTIKFYLENGADPDKLVLGIPTYGRSYTLFNADAVDIGSPADGPGEQGDATKEKGYLAYYEICEALKPKEKKKRSLSSDEDLEEYSEEEEVEEEWTIMHPNPKAMGPVAYKGNQWVGYDDVDIVKKKAEYVADNGLGGIMFWSIDNDDFRGNCHSKPYPLIEAAKEAYISKLGSTGNILTVTEKVKTGRPGSRRRNKPKAASTTTTQKPSAAKSNKRKNSLSSTTPSWNIITPEPPTTPDPGSDFKCVDEGFYQHPRDCKKYFWCLDSGPSNLGIVAHQFTCPSGLFFNKAADSCDFARNVLCKLPAETTKAPATKAPKTTAAPVTTRKPIKLSTKDSALFRTTTTTVAPEPESEEEYEEEVLEDTFDEDSEDPRVIKELIDLIKKVGGVEQLEKQLHRAETSASTDGASSTTPSPFNKKLYQKVLERARGTNKYTDNNVPQNSRRGPQSQGIEATPEKDRLISKDRSFNKDRPQYTTIKRNRQSTSTTEEPLESAEAEEPERPVQALSRARAVESEASIGTTAKSLQYVNIRRARPTSTSSDTADDTASRNALFERSETYVSVSEQPNSLDVASARKENQPEYVTIRRQRPTTEEATTIQYEEANSEVDIQETALEREISSQPQYTSIVRARSTTSPPQDPSTEQAFTATRPTTYSAPEESSPEPTTVLAVQISSLLNSPNSAEDTSAPATAQAQTEADVVTTSTAAPSSATPRRSLLRRRGSTTTTTPAPSSSTTQTARRTILRRTKATAPPDTSDESDDYEDAETLEANRRDALEAAKKIKAAEASRKEAIAFDKEVVASKKEAEASKLEAEAFVREAAERNSTGTTSRPQRRGPSRFKLRQEAVVLRKEAAASRKEAAATRQEGPSTDIPEETITTEKTETINTDSRDAYEAAKKIKAAEASRKEAIASQKEADAFEKEVVASKKEDEASKLEAEAFVREAAERNSTGTTSRPQRRGPNRFKSRKEAVSLRKAAIASRKEAIELRKEAEASRKEVERNETSVGEGIDSRIRGRRPTVIAGARLTERPAPAATRNVRRRVGGGNGYTGTTPAPSTSSATVTRRRPFRIASRRRPPSATATTTTSTTPQPTTLPESEELLQDVGDIDAIEDPTLEPRRAKNGSKIQRRPLVNLKDDQNPSATTEEERRRQSKKYSSNFKQNQLDDILKKSEEVTTEASTTVEDNAETALAIATHQLITAPLPSTDFEGTSRNTEYTSSNTVYTKTPTYYEEYTTGFRTVPTQDSVQTTIGETYSIYDTPRITTVEDFATADLTTKPRRPVYSTTDYETKTTYDIPKTTSSLRNGNIDQTDINTGKFTLETFPTTFPREATDYETKTSYDIPKTTNSLRNGNNDQTDSNTGKFTLETFPTTFPREATDYETKTTYDIPKTTSSLRNSNNDQTDMNTGEFTLETFTTTVPIEGYTNIPTDFGRLSPTTFEVPKLSTLSRYPTTPVYQTVTNQYVPTTRDYTTARVYTETTDSSSYLTPRTLASRDYSSPNVITSGYSGVQRGGVKFENDKYATIPAVPENTAKYTTIPVEDTRSTRTRYTTVSEDSGSTVGYTSISQDPAGFFTREYLLESPVTKTSDDEYQYLSPTTPQTTTRKVFRKKIQRRISTTIRPTTSAVLSVRSTTPTYIPEVTTRPTQRPRMPSKKPFEKIAKTEPIRTHKPVVNYDYYDDSAEKVALKYAEGTKVILHGKGSIECLDVGNFPHPSSCKKFISCARMEFGALLGWEYVCPQGLSFDPVGGICNWSAGLGCDEKDD